MVAGDFAFPGVIFGVCALDLSANLPELSCSPSLCVGNFIEGWRGDSHGLYLLVTVRDR